MTGGLIQLSAYGKQDLHLTGNPQISFFKVVYRRHTNFSIESIEQTINGGITFGNTIECSVARAGDLIHNIWIQLKLPPATDVISCANQNDTSVYRRWVNNIGHALVKQASIFIGGLKIDSQVSEWFDIWNELTDTNRLYWNLLGKNETVYGINKNTNSRYYIPLQFWFNRNVGLALPLIALQYHEVLLKIEIRELDSLILTNGTSVAVNGEIEEFSIFIDYIHLDNEERQRFAQNSHEYLIEQVQNTNHDTLQDGNNSVSLDLNYPVKEIVWALRHNQRGTKDINSKVNKTSSDINGNDWFNYSATSINQDLNYSTFDTFNTAKLVFNGLDRFKERDALYFRQVQPIQYHSNVPKKHIYVYSFALKPEQHQPSGTCNFSRLDNAQLILTGVKQSDLLLFATNYNILRIQGGMGGLAYTT